MSSNYPAIVAGLKARIETIAAIKNVYEYFPEAIGSTPAVIFHRRSSRMVPPTYGELAIEWTFSGWVAIEQTNFKVAEATLGTLVPQIYEAVYTDLDAGGSLTDGQALFESTAWGRLTVARVTYAAEPFTLTVVERYSLQAAL